MPASGVVRKAPLCFNGWMSYKETNPGFSFIDHPRSGVVYNFGPVCLSVCLYVCLYVCLFVSQKITSEALTYPVGSSYLHMPYISTDYIRVEFVYGHRLK